MKIAFVDCTLPELPSSKMYHTGRGEGASAKAAISRAFGDMFKKIKGRRVSFIQAKINLTTKVKDSVTEEENNVPA